MTLRIVATADNHLGHYNARMPLRTLERRRQRLRAAFGQVCDAAIAGKAQLLVLAGDVFDTPTPRNIDRVYVARQLAALQRHGIVTVGISGNHDTPRAPSDEGADTPVQVYAELGALHVFGFPGNDRVVRPRCLHLAGYRVEVGGFTPHPGLAANADQLEEIIFESAGADLRILVVHGVVEGTVPPHWPAAMMRRQSIAQLAGCVDVVIAGDVHAPVHTNCAGVHVVVPGATEHFTFNENWTPGFAWIEFDGSQVQVRHEALTPQPRCNLTLAAADVGDDPTGAALALVRAHANSDTIARLAVTGVLRREQYRRLNAAVIEDAGRRSYFAFELDLRDLRVQFDTGENRSWAPRRTMAEEVRAVIEEDLARTRDPAERALLERTRDELLAALLAEGEEAAR